MKASEVREKYLQFFEKRGHVRINPAPLVLENDPTTLFTSSGMQPLVPYLMGEKHSEGTRLVDSQPSIRLQDIEEVGDNRHTTFFEMLGNWSLGDYFKKEQLPWFFEFLTNELGLSKDKLWVSVFEGNDQVSKDTESVEIWKSLGISEERIGYYPAKKNWWSRNGTPDEMPIGDIGGPDSEVFYDFGENLKLHENSAFKNEKCHMNCDCGRFLEIGNSVFMQYKKVGVGKLEELPNKNVDFGGGLERLTAAVNNDPDIFNIDIFSDLINLAQIGMKVPYDKDKASYRIITDHIKAATFMTKYGVVPSNKQQGYVMRRLIRRSVVKQRKINDNVIEPNVFTNLVSDVFDKYKDIYFKGEQKSKFQEIIFDEVDKFTRTLERGFKEIEKVKNLDANIAFDLYQSYGFPFEITLEIAEEKGQKISKIGFEKEFEKHKDGSRTAGKGMFKGGLADHSPEVVRLHTATHLLQAALRKVLGEHVLQKGQNITSERSRFDFNNPEKLTAGQLREVEDMINEKIKEALPVGYKLMKKEEAEKTNAIHAFGEKYGDEVNVYFVGESLETAFSKEFCGGPHVANTSEIGPIKIQKQEKIGQGIVRIYLTLEK